MLPNETPAVAGGNEAVELIRILTNQPESLLRNQLLEKIQQTLLAHSSAAEAIEAEVARLTRDVPAFIRLPKPGERCLHTGLSRTAMVELVAPCDRNDQRPPVKAIYKRSNPRAQRGVWHIPARNLFRYLLQQEEVATENFLAMREARKEAGEQRA